MGDPKPKKSGQDLDSLRIRACERIDQGFLPRAKAASTWGGRGTGLSCDLCDRPILSSEPEMELEFEGAEGTRTLRFHLQCHSAWDTERRAPVATAWVSIEKALPPYEAAVEARLRLGGGRVVILSVVRREGGAGGSEWVNAVTRASLPATWTPLEWRYPAGVEGVAERLGESESKRA